MRVSDEPKPIKGVPIPTKRIEELCSRWHITKLEVFGSAVRDDFSPESDIDLLVTFERDATITLFHLVEIKEELEEMFGCPVDLVSRKAIERSDNPYRREAILTSAKVIYDKAA